MNKKLKIVLFALFLIGLGFFRENLFVSLNGIMYNKYFNPHDYDRHAIRPAFQFLNYFSYYTLYTGKWIITPFFAFIFWFVQKKFLSFLFNEKKTSLWLGLLYLSLFLLAGISFCLGWLTGHLQEGYRFSRIFMGLLESAVPCMILIPLTYFYINHKTET